MHLQKHFYLLAIIAGLFSCNDASKIYEDIHVFEEGVWHKDSVQDFTFKVEDTTHAYNFIYLFRNTLDYPYYNLYVKYELKDSTGNVLAEDMQEVYLFNHKSGKPGGEERYFTGKSLGGIYDHAYPALMKVHFRQEGTYTLSLSQYMRKPNPLPEILSVGLRVNKYEE